MTTTLLLPGGTVNPDQLRINNDAVAFVKAFVATGKPIASICHGPWTLLEADAVRGRRLTFWPSLWTDLRHAGAEVLDQEVVIDGQLPSAAPPPTCRRSVRRLSSSSLRPANRHAAARADRRSHNRW